MKKTPVLLLLAVMSFACVNVETTEEPEVTPVEKPTDGAFIHISKGSADAHDVLMALMLADKFSTSNDVLVFFDKEGIELVTKEAPNLELAPFDPSDEIFERLIKEGVEILACPACMQLAGVSKEQLREGVKIAEKERFFDFTEGRILSLDY